MKRYGQKTRQTLRLALAVLTGLAGQVCAAGDMADSETEILTLGDSQLLLSRDEPGMSRLFYKDELLIDSAYIDPGEQLLVEGHFLRVLSLSTGGSVCSGGMAVLWEAEGRVLISETTDPCLYPATVLEGERLQLRVRPLPGVPGAGWEWSPGTGLTALPATEFAPDETQDWNAPEWMTMVHPIDMLSLAPIYHQFRDTLSARDFNTLAVTLSETGWGNQLEEGYEGFACAKWECDEHFAWLWVDPREQRAYALWSSAEEGGASPLPLQDWPIWIVKRADEHLNAN